MPIQRDDNSCLSILDLGLLPLLVKTVSIAFDRDQLTLNSNRRQLVAHVDS